MIRCQLLNFFTCLFTDQGVVIEAQQRKDAIIKYLWDPGLGYFFDFDIKLKRRSNVESLAGAVPLFVELIDETMTTRIAQRIEAQFLVSGGLITTLNHSHQQWDSPNGWAPLHWFAVKGLLNYQQEPLALTVIERWLDTVEQHFVRHRNIMLSLLMIWPRAGNTKYSMGLAGQMA